MIRSESQSVFPMTVDDIGKAEVLLNREHAQDAREVLQEMS